LGLTAKPTELLPPRSKTEDREGPSAGGPGGQWRRRSGRREAQLSAGTGRGGRGELRDVLTLEGERRQGGRWRHAAAAGGGFTWRRCSGGFPAAGSGETGRARRVDACDDGGLHRGNL
jgi:hypothetical protein